jgi:hypothetical protein
MVQGPLDKPIETFQQWLLDVLCLSISLAF